MADETSTDEPPTTATPTITTSAVGRSRAPPDRVDLQFEVASVEPDVTSARRVVAERATTLRSVLGDAGVSDERVRTQRFRVHQRPPRGRENRDRPDDPEDRPYEATETVGVTLDDLDALGRVLEAGVDEAGAEIDGVNFTFRTETKRELEREAIGDAVATARQKAEAAATAEDMAVGDVRSMTTDDRSHPRQSASALSAEVEQGRASAPASGPIAVTVAVEVAYELVEAT